MDPIPVVVATVAAIIVFLIDEEDTLMLSELERRKHRYWMKKWYLDRHHANENNTMYKFQRQLLQLGDVDEFHATLRMPPDVYSDLLEDIRPLITKKDTNYRRCISAEERLSLTMRYRALGESYRSLRQAYRIGYSTVGRIIRETCTAIYEKLQPRYLVTPSTKEEWLEVARNFAIRWNFPHVCGALDGKHIRIRAPPKSGSFFFNNKNFYSIVLMALVDANYKFLFIDVGAEGKASDGGIWKNCNLFELLEDEENPLDFPAPSPIPGIDSNIPYYFVGDDAFALSVNLQKPFPEHGLTPRDRIFNYRLSRSRMVVENAFGILSTKFRIFRREIKMYPEGAEKIVLASCVLHNMLRDKCGRSYMPEKSVDYIDNEHIRQPGLWREETPLVDIEATRHRHVREYCRNLRDRLANYFLQKEGEVPWQYKSSLVEKMFK